MTDTMRLAGILVVSFAAVGMLVDLGAHLRTDPSGLPARLGSAFVALIFGLALIQHVNSVRIFLLVVSGLALPAVIVLLALVKSEPTLWVIGGATLVMVTGYILLLLQREAGAGFAISGGALVIVGSLVVGSAPFWRPAVARATFARDLAAAASSDSNFTHAASGLWIAAPGEWLRLRTESRLMKDTDAAAAFANPKTRTVSFLHIIEGDFVPGMLDKHIDTILARRMEDNPSLEETRRVDLELAGVAARRADTTWTSDGEGLSGSILAFAHGQRLFAISSVTYGPPTQEASTQLAALESAFRFPDVRKVDVDGAVRTLGASCPALAPGIVRTLAPSMPDGAQPALWFHRAWSDATHGQPLLPTERAEQLRAVMREAFASMTDAERNAFGAYAGRLGEGLPTTNEQEDQAAKAINSAFGRMPAASQARLHELTELAFTMGSIR